MIHALRSPDGLDQRQNVWDVRTIRCKIPDRPLADALRADHQESLLNTSLGDSALVVVDVVGRECAVHVHDQRERTVSRLLRNRQVVLALYTVEFE